MLETVHSQSVVLNDRYIDWGQIGRWPSFPIIRVFLLTIIMYKKKSAIQKIFAY